MITNMAAIDSLTVVVLSLIACPAACFEFSDSDSGKPCTYYESTGTIRRSRNEDNLINCTWYQHNACCKRTEVTSVFGAMLELEDATVECSNQLEYMMCYFCSPEQYRWYRGQVHICKDYCLSVYEHCKTASHHGIALGLSYSSGEDFCRGQRFEVVEGNGVCFDFDPDVFGGVSSIHALTVSMTVLLGIFFTLSREITFR